LRKQALDGAGRHVTLDDIACHFRRVAGDEVGRHAETLLDGIEVAGLGEPDWKAGTLEMLDPSAATAATRIAMDDDLG
jgi:hypothetical protein